MLNMLIFLQIIICILINDNVLIFQRKWLIFRRLRRETFRETYSEIFTKFGFFGYVISDNIV